MPKTYKEVQHTCISSVCQATAKLPDCQQIVKQDSIKTFRLQHRHTGVNVLSSCQSMHKMTIATVITPTCHAVESNQQIQPKQSNLISQGSNSNSSC